MSELRFDSHLHYLVSAGYKDNARFTYLRWKAREFMYRLTHEKQCTVMGKS